MSTYVPSEAEVEEGANRIARHAYLGDDVILDRDDLIVFARAALGAARAVTPEAPVDPARYWRERAERAEMERDQWRDALEQTQATTTPSTEDRNRA